jgi:hypothetical protein
MLDRVHKIAEIVAAFAIVGSLIFVGIQMNQNTNALRASFIQSSIESWNTHAMEMASNDDLMASFNDSIYPELIEKFGPRSTSQSQFSMWINASLRTTEMLFLQWQSGHLPDDIWHGYHEGLIASFAGTSAFSDVWSVGKFRFSPSFRAYIDALQIEAGERRAQFLATD